MKYIISRYNHDISWIPEYTDDFVLYDRSEKPLKNSIFVSNIGSDIYDKFTYIIDNYDNLPDVAVYTKANIFKYIDRKDFDKIKNNKTFTPLLGKNHSIIKGTSFNISGQTRFFKEKESQDILRIYNLPPLLREEVGYFSFYKDNMYYELDNLAYLTQHPAKNIESVRELKELLGIVEGTYIPFVPGSNYIVPKRNILKHSKVFYVKLRSYLDWTVYPGEAQIIERGLYTLWL